MRKYTFISLILAALCITALFCVSQRTRVARSEIGIVRSDIEQEKESIRVLKAEWSYLNRPQRLEELAAKYLEIEKTRPHQFIKLDDVKVASNLLPEIKQDGLDKVKIAATKIFKQKVIETLAAQPELAGEVGEEVAEKRGAGETFVAKGNDRSFSALIRAWGND